MKEESIERRRLKNDLTKELTRLEIHAKEHFKDGDPALLQCIRDVYQLLGDLNLDQDKNRNKARILDNELNGKECIDETGGA